MNAVSIHMGRLLPGLLVVAMAIAPLVVVKKKHGSPKNVVKHDSTSKAQHSTVQWTSDLPKGVEYDPPLHTEGAIENATKVAKLKQQLATALEELQIERREHAITRAQNIELMEDLRSKREEVLVARAEAQCAKDICMLSLSEARRELQAVGSITQEKAATDEATIVRLQSRVAWLEAKDSPEGSQSEGLVGAKVQGLEDISPWLVDRDNQNLDPPSPFPFKLAEREPFEGFGRPPLYPNRDCMPGPSMREVISQKERKIAVLNDRLSECYNQLQLVTSQNSSRGTVFHASELSYFDPYEQVEEWKAKSYSAPPSTGRPGSP
jgi:hypothetical protein